VVELPQGLLHLANHFEIHARTLERGQASGHSVLSHAHRF
jgi:hypothetical protein